MNRTSLIPCPNANITNANGPKRVFPRARPIPNVPWSAAAVVLAGLAAITAQSATKPVGWIRCEIQAEAPGYWHQETQLWKITKDQYQAPNGKLCQRAEWSVSGQGWLRRAQSSQSQVADWTISAPGSNPPMYAGIEFVGIDGPLGLVADSRPRVEAVPPPPVGLSALTGSNQLLDNGATQPALRLVQNVVGWQFQSFQIANPATRGPQQRSFSYEVKAVVGPHQPADARVTVTVDYSFGMESAPPLPPSNLAPKPPPGSPANVMSGAACPQPNASNRVLESRVTELERLVAELQRLAADLARRLAIVEATTGRLAGVTGSNTTPTVSSGNGPSNSGVNGSVSSGGNPRPPVPQLMSLTPNSGTQGARDLRVTLVGRGTHWEAAITKFDFGPGVTAQPSPSGISATEASVVVTIARDAAFGPRTVTVTTGLETVRLPDVFSITPVASPIIPTLGVRERPTVNKSDSPRLSRVLIPPSGSSPGTSSVPPASGNYLVTMTGAWCVKPTADDPLEFDGKGDEIYCAAFVRRYDRKTFQIQEHTSRRTREYGDANRSDRIQAGSRSPLGGIKAGDPIPPGATASRNVPAQESLFPLMLWQGKLADDADAIVISTSIWESDGEPSYYSAWVAKQGELNESIFLFKTLQDQIQAKRFGFVDLGATETLDNRLETVLKNVALTLPAVLAGLPPVHWFMGAHDCPIGLVGNKFETALPNTVVVLTREIIETALAAPPAPEVKVAGGAFLIPDTKPGTLVITFGNTPVDSAFYAMALQVERLQ